MKVGRVIGCMCGFGREVDCMCDIFFEIEVLTRDEKVGGCIVVKKYIAIDFVR